jgi:hypothetical protein
MRKRFGVLCLAVSLSTVLPGPSAAQDVESVKRELDTMRQQFESLRQQYERRLKELGDRLQTLEAQQRAPAAPPVSTTTTQTPSPPLPAAGGARAADGPSLEQLVTPRQPFAFAQPGRTLLFDIGASGDFVANVTSNRSGRRRDGTFDGRENRLFPREVSVGIFGRVDPYASAILRLAAGEDAPAEGARRSAEISVNLEEANATLLTLPWGTMARFGLMRPRFGTLNVVHMDDLPQVDRPNVLKRFFGEEQMNLEKGLEAGWILPTPFYEEISLGVFNGDNETAFGRGDLRDPLVLGRLRNFFETDDWGALQLDLSAGTGRTVDDRRNTVAGVGLKYKWSPSTGYAFPVLTLAGEAIHGNRALRDDTGELRERRAERWGYYGYGQLDLDRRWAGGLRYDWTELPASSGREWALSPYLQFKPSEFLRFRLQYKHTTGSASVSRDADEIFLQGSFILGAHPTERF